MSLQFHQYMEYVTRDSNLHISRIDHHRNILCLHTAFHVVLGRSRLAFLQVFSAILFITCWLYDIYRHPMAGSKEMIYLVNLAMTHPRL